MPKGLFYLLFIKEVCEKTSYKLSASEYKKWKNSLPDEVKDKYPNIYPHIK